MGTPIEDAITEQGTVDLMNLSGVAGPMSAQEEFDMPMKNDKPGGRRMKIPLSTTKKPYVTVDARTGAWAWRLHGQNKATDRGIRLYFENDDERNAANMKLVAQQTECIATKKWPIPSARALYPNYGPLAGDAIPDGVVTTETLRFAEKQKARLQAQGAAIAAAGKPTQPAA